MCWIIWHPVWRKTTFWRFPDLTREDIKACLAFAADREAEIVFGWAVNLPFDQGIKPS